MSHQRHRPAPGGRGDPILIHGTTTTGGGRPRRDEGLSTSANFKGFPTGYAGRFAALSGQACSLSLGPLEQPLLSETSPAAGRQQLRLPAAAPEAHPLACSGVCRSWRNLELRVLGVPTPPETSPPTGLRHRLEGAGRGHQAARQSDAVIDGSDARNGSNQPRACCFDP